MALFSRKTKTEKQTKAKSTAANAGATAKNAAATTTASVGKHAYGSIILAPHITEKAAVVSGLSNTYIFRIHQNATKPLVAKAIREIYSVTPVKVTIAQNPAKRVIVRGKAGKMAARRKAYVQLKKGDKIEFV